MNQNIKVVHKINPEEKVEIVKSPVTQYGGTFILEVMLERNIKVVSNLDLSEHAKDELVAHLFHIEVVERRDIVEVTVIK